jgi:hypothetical protein
MERRQIACTNLDIRAQEQFSDTERRQIAHTNTENRAQEQVANEKICPSGGSIGRTSKSAIGLSHENGVSEMAEYCEKVPRTSVRPHVDLVPGRNGTGTRLRRMLTLDSEEHASGVWFPLTSVVRFITFLVLWTNNSN